MAIEDNTVYGLTGAQVKELPERIEAVKGQAKVLTSADYNYPTTGTKTTIALWLLDEGIYRAGDSAVAFKPTSTVNTTLSAHHMLIVTKTGNNKFATIGIYPASGDTNTLTVTKVRTDDGNVLVTGNLPTDVVNNLTSTSTTAALSAAQGKALKDLIDAIVVPTKTSDLTNDSDYQTGSQVSTAIGTETTARQNADVNLQGQIDAIVASSDVKDIVGTKADLNNYDTTTLGDNDIIKVLADESQSGATTYYRWSVSGAAFTLIGSEGPYYTKSQTDTLVNAKADASTTYTKTEVDTALNGKVDNATLSNYATTAAMNTALAGKADAPAAGTTYVTDAAMATALADKANTADLSTVATSGDYDDLTDKPVLKNAGAPTTATVGTKGQLLEDTTNGELYQCTAVSGNTYTWKKITKTNIITMTGRGQTGGMLTEEVPSLLLAGKPTANSPYALLTDYDSDDNANTWSYIKTNRSYTGDVYNVYAGYYFYDGAEDLYSTNSARLALYSDLPTVNDATLTIQKNGTTVDTFTANSSTNKTVNIETPVITMTSTDPGEGSALAENNYVAVYGGDPIILDYSLSEINTGAKWIDGSAIYKKTVSTGALPNTNATYTQHNISNMSKVIKAEGYATDGTTFHPLPYANTASNGSVAVQVTSTNIMLSTTSDQSAYTESYITLYYTKSS